MSQGALGGASLSTELLTKTFEQSLKGLEQTTLASFKRMSGLSEGIISPKAFSGAKGDVQALSGVLKPLETQLKNVSAEGSKVGTGLGVSAGKAKKAVDPLEISILGLKNQVAGLRNTTEALDRPLNESVADFQRLKTASLELATGLEKDSKQYRDLTGVAATASRSMKTLSGEQTKLGLSGNVAIGNAKSLRTGFVGLQGAIGPLIGITGIAGVVRGLGNMESAFQEANKTIRTGTGATGDALKGLTDSFKTVAKTASQDLGSVATVLADLNTRTGATGDSLESLTSTMLDLSRVTGEDVNGLVKETTRLFGDWGVATENQAGTLDYLFKVSQNTGITVGKLSENLVKYGAPLRQLGFDFETSAALMGKFEQEGVNTELVLGSLRIALGKMSKEGVTDTNEALSTLVDQIQNAGSAGEANALAIETFGARAGPDMAAAIREGRFEVDELLNSLEASGETIKGAAKESQTFNERMGEFRNAVSVAAEPLGGALLTGLEGTLGLFQQLPGPAQQAALGIGGISAATTVLGGSMGILRAAMLPLFAPPTGLLIAGVAVAAGLGLAIYTAGQKHEDAAEKVSRLKTEAENIVPALDGIKTATSKQQLLGNIETLAETMDGDAKTAFVSYAQTAVDSAKTTGEAVIGIMQGIAVARKSILEDAVRAQASLLKDLERNQQESQTGFNIATATGGTGRESSAITRLQSDLAEARTLVTESEQAITKAVAAGYSIRETYFRQQLEQDKALVTQIIGEIGNEIENTPAGRLNYDTSQAEQATRDLRGLQGQLDELNQLVETGTSEQIEAYFSRGAEGALKLSASTEPAATGVAKVGKAGDDAAAGLDSAGTAGANAATGVETVGTAADKTATQFETAMDAATAWATRLTREAQQNVKPAAEVIGTFKDRVVELQKEQERLAKAGLAGGKQYDLAEQKISLLTGAIDELTKSQDEQTAKAIVIPKAYAKVTDAVDVSNKAYAKVTDVVDLSNKAYAQVKPAVDIAIKGYAQVKDGVDIMVKAYADVPDEVAIPIPDAKPIIDHAKILEDSLPKAYKAAETENDIFNTGLSEAEIRAGVAKDKLRELVDQGLDPQSEAVQKARAEWLLYQGQVDSAADTLGAASYVLTELGQLATDALTNVEGLGQGGQIALGAFSGAATAAGAALEDGMLSTTDGFNIVSGLIDGVVSQLGDDVPAETKIAGSALSGVFSGAAAGAQFGPWGAVAGGVIGGISGLFGGIAEEQEKVRKAQEAITKAAEDTLKVARELKDESEAGQTATGSDVLQAKVDANTPSDGFKDNKKGKKDAAIVELAQARVDLVNLTEEYTGLIKDADSRLEQIMTEIGNANRILTDPNATTAAKDDAREALGKLEESRIDTQGELDNLKTLYGYDVQEVLKAAEDAAKKLGLSDKQLYEAILTGDDKILGQLNPEQRQAIFMSLSAYYEEFGVLPEGAAEAAASLGLSTDQLTQALRDNDVSLGVATANGTTATRQGVADLNQQLLDFFGPEKSAEIRAMILGLYNDQASALGEGDQTLATTATGADAGPAALGGILDQVTALLGDKAGPVIDLINQTYADMGGAVGTSTTTLSTQATGSSTTVSGDLSGIFTSAQNAITATAPGATSALTTALSGIRTGLGNEADPLGKSLQANEKALAERNKQLFLEQEIMAGKHGPGAKAALEAQIAAERKALYDSVYGSGGLSPFLVITQGTLSGVLSSFFTTQGTTVTNQGGGLVGDIDDIATKISRAMSGLASAAVPPKGVGKFSFGTKGGKGKVPALASGGLVKRPTFALVGEAGPELVVPLNKLHGLIQTALGEMSVPVKGGFDVSGASKDIVRSISQAGKAEAGAYRAAGSAKAFGIASETEQVQRALAQADKQQAAFIKKYGKKKVRANDEQKKAYAENKKALLAFERETFDLIDGRALTGYNIKGHKDGFLDGLLAPLLGGKVNLIEGLTDKQQGIIDFAQQVGTSLEQSVFSGVSAGLKTAVKGGVPDLKGITEGIFDNVADSLIGKLQTQVLASALGPLLTDITADITRGNVAGAAKGVQKIAGKLPGLISNFQKLLSPLTGAYSALGLGQKDETQRGEVITIESPIADLSSITELLSQIRSLTTPGAISQTALSGAAPTITALPSYQAQQEALNVPMFNTAVNRFDSATVRFERSAARLESLFKSRGNVISDAARGKGVSVFNLT